MINFLKHLLLVLVLSIIIGQITRWLGANDWTQGYVSGCAVGIVITITESFKKGKES